MEQKRIIVFCLSDPKKDPRPNRVISCLKDHYDIIVVSNNEYNNGNIKSITFSANKNIYKKLERLLLLALRQYKRILWGPESKQLLQDIKKFSFEAIICHDVLMLPLVHQLNQNAKLIFDAREFYPKQFEDDIIWRLLYKDFNEYLCKNYLSECDHILTVSEGIAKEYKREYNVSAEVFQSWPQFVDLAPTNVDNQKIKIIHHGNAQPSRKIESMIRVMDYVDDRFHLDLMLVNTSAKYYRFLKTEVSKRSNISIIPPVEFGNIVQFINSYDIGLYLTKPQSFNMEHMLPNKFFEFIQARLAIAIGPSIEMKSIVKKYDIGIVSKEFSPGSLAYELNNLTEEKLAYYKSNSNELAYQFNAHKNCLKIRQIIDGLLTLMK